MWIFFLKKCHMELEFCKLKFTILELTKLKFFVNTKLECNALFFLLLWYSSLPITFFPYNQQINKKIKISDFFFFFHLNAQTYVFIYLNRSIVKYRNFNFKILIFRLLIPLVHSFLTHSSISSFSEALWSNWFKYWGLQ